MEYGHGLSLYYVTQLEKGGMQDSGKRDHDERHTSAAFGLLPRWQVLNPVNMISPVGLNKTPI